MNKYVLIYIIIFLVHFIRSNDLLYKRLNKTIHEIEAINIIKQSIYARETISNLETLELIYKRNWIKASRLIIDFLVDNSKPETSTMIRDMLEYMENYLSELKGLLSEKKKNIVKISPLFQWSQDEKWVRIRVKFARNIDSPSEKDIENFQVNVTHSNLIVNGYKNHEDYLIWYHRDMITYDNIRDRSLIFYKETDGSYLIKFEKLQFTLYWAYLDTPSGSHANIILWMDMFEKFENRKQYFEKTMEIESMIYHRELHDNKKRKLTERKKRINKILKLDQFLRNKDMTNKNFCNSPVNHAYCIIPKPDEWAYWLL